MTIGESHPFGSQPIHVGRWDLAAIGKIGLHIAIAQIICQEDHHVGLLGTRCPAATADYEAKKKSYPPAIDHPTHRSSSFIKTATESNCVAWHGESKRVPRPR
jgi:hypothetical protein